MASRSTVWWIGVLLTLCSIASPVGAAELACGLSGGVITPGPSTIKDGPAFTLSVDLERDSHWTLGGFAVVQQGRGDLQNDVGVFGLGVRVGHSLQAGPVRVHPTAALAMYRQSYELPPTAIGFADDTLERGLLALPLTLALEVPLGTAWRVGARETVHVTLSGLSPTEGVEDSNTWFSSEFLLTWVLPRR